MSHLYEIKMLGGTFTVRPRDTSYHAPKFGPNREDRFSMFFEYEGHTYLIGSHPSLKGAIGWAAHRAEHPEKLFNYLGLTELINLTKGAKKCRQ